MKIGIDGRRNFGSGIGRVTSNIIEGLIEYDKNNEYIVFISSPREWRATNVKVEICDIQFFSKADLYDFPKYIARNNVDVFISPQFYISPFIECPTIKFVHDLWPLFYPNWVPSQSDFHSNFGKDSVIGIEMFLGEFLNLYNKIFFTNKNNFIEMALNNKELTPPQKYVIFMMACTLWTANKIIIPSNHTRQEIISTFPEVQSKLGVMAHFPSPIFYSKPDTKRGNYILHVSKWEPRKNLEQVIKVGQLIYKQFGLNLILVGDQGYRDYGREIKRVISTPPYSNYIQHLGIIDDNRLNEIYQQAKFFLFPSLYEGFGIPPLEAMACGTPVISGDGGSLPEICGDAAILINPNDTKAIFKAAAELLTDEILYEDMVQKGFKRLSSFSRSGSIRSLMQNITSITESPHLKN